MSELIYRQITYTASIKSYVQVEGTVMNYSLNRFTNICKTRFYRNLNNYFKSKQKQIFPYKINTDRNEDLPVFVI